MEKYSHFNEVRKIFVSFLFGGMLFCACTTDCMDDVQHSNSSVNKVDKTSRERSEMYDYIYSLYRTHVIYSYIELTLFYHIYFSYTPEKASGHRNNKKPIPLNP